jgi:hypothetical protein
MAVETTYIVGEVLAGHGYPAVLRVISVDGVEVSRGEPDFEEITAAAPQIVSEYHAAVAMYLTNFASAITAGEHDNFTENLCEHIMSLRFLVTNYTGKFDYSRDADSFIPYLGDDGSAEETPE